jgi:putative inorganic carbon (HCO3(-)) transporter
MSVSRRSTALLGVIGGAIFIVVAVGVARRTSTERIPVVLLLGVGAIPLGIYLAFRVSVALTAAAGICLSVFGGDWGYVGTHLPLDRVLIGLALARLIYQRITRSTGSRRLLITDRTHLLLVLAATYALISAALASTLLTKAGSSALLDKFTIVGFVLYAISPILFPTEKERRYMIAALVVLGAYLSLTALAEGLSVNALVFPRYILNPALGEHFGRARGPFLEAASNGLALVLCAAACYVAVRTWRSRWSRRAAALVGVACLGSVLFTLTRQVWIGAALAVLAALVFTPELRRYLLPAVVLSVVVVGGALVTVPGLSSKASSRADDNQSVWDRLNSDNAALRMIEARPLFGFGWDTYGENAGPYYRLAATYPLPNEVDAVHDVALSNLVELGVLGTGLWLAALIAVYGRALRRRGNSSEERALWTAVLMCVTCYVVVSQFTPLDYEFDNITVWLFAGLLASVRSERAVVTKPLDPAPEVGRSYGSA